MFLKISLGRISYGGDICGFCLFVEYFVWLKIISDSANDSFIEL